MIDMMPPHLLLHKSNKTLIFLFFFFLNSILVFGQNDPIYGCTEPLACNYNPDATVNDGSCQYGICGVDCVDVEVSGSSGGNWEIIDSNGTTVASNLVFWLSTINSCNDFLVVGDL